MKTLHILLCVLLWEICQAEINANRSKILADKFTEIRAQLRIENKLKSVQNQSERISKRSACPGKEKFSLFKYFIVNFLSNIRLKT
jgi:hypothetical protein